MQCYESINLQLEIAYVKLTILFFLMNLRKSKYFIWTIILFVSTSLPSIVEVFSSWNSQLTFKQEETQILKHFIKYEVVFSFWAIKGDSEAIFDSACAQYKTSWGLFGLFYLLLVDQIPFTTLYWFNIRSFRQ